MLTDNEIAVQADIWPINRVAKKLGFQPSNLYCYGDSIAKVRMSSHVFTSHHQRSSIVLVTAMSPTPAGEGKTTTSIGLLDALWHVDKKYRYVACLREPSMGPVFGMKGGAAGGGYAQAIPMAELNLHFTGDIAAITAAHNLLSAMIDNHIHQGNQCCIDPKQVVWTRVLDINDRALRQCVIGLGSSINGQLRQDSFTITAASEVMAVFCLARDISDLKERLGRMIVAYSYTGEPVTARQIGAVGAMSALLVHALQPNLIQSLEHNPILIHGGPFGNIAHGCSSVIADRLGKACADVVITEAGFGADLGAEKYLDLVSRSQTEINLFPDVTVLVATVRALKYHGGVDVAHIEKENIPALMKGYENLHQHIDNLRRIWNITPIVAINRFPSDTDSQIQALQDLLRQEGIVSCVCTHFTDGGKGAIELAQQVLSHLKPSLSSPSSAAFSLKPSHEGNLTRSMRSVQEKAHEASHPTEEKNSVHQREVTYPYQLSDDIEKKIHLLSEKLYGATSVIFEPAARKQLKQIEKHGYGNLPLCIAKTHYSFSTDPSKRGAPKNHTIRIRNLHVSAGAGFIVVLAGNVMTMPGLPRHPAALDIDIDNDGRIHGLF